MFVADPFFDVVFRGLVLTMVAMCWVIVLVRINGLRSFSKMTSFDFVMTVAVGSLLAGASQSTSWPAFAQTLAALAALFLVQWATARLRKVSGIFERLTQNRPVVLMRDGEIIENAMLQTRVAESDLFAKLREANVLHLSEVRAVVLETTGDISVLHGDSCAPELLRGTTEFDQ